MGEATLLIFGFVIIVLGIVNMKGYVITVRWHNRHRVEEEELSKYGKIIGLGTIVIGLGLVLAYLVSLWNDDYVRAILILSSVIGICIMLYAQLRYNKGIF